MSTRSLNFPIVPDRLKGQNNDIIDFWEDGDQNGPALLIKITGYEELFFDHETTSRLYQILKTRANKFEKTL